MKITALKISNFLGIDELEWNPGAKINILEGPKGSGKSSVVEAIEKAFSNQGRRTELIRHGEDEATIYVETDTGLEIDRRLRAERADYFRLRQEGKGIDSTETFLRQFIRGDIFRPLDFPALSIKEQTEIILGMIRMDYSAEEIREWFRGQPLHGVNWDKHVLQVLKDIETGFYKDREEINREIRSLRAQAAGIERDLPPNYDGDKWAAKDVQDYYRKVAEAEEKNRYYESAKNLRESFDDRVKGIKGEAEVAKSEVRRRYTSKKEALEEGIRLFKGDIQDAEDGIKRGESQKAKRLQDCDTWYQAELEKLQEKRDEMKRNIEEEAKQKMEAQTAKIQEVREGIAAYEGRLEGLDDKEKLELEAVEKETRHKLVLEEERLGKAKAYLEGAKPIDVKPLQEAAEEVAKMQGYLREWDRKARIESQLARRKEESEYLTGLIEIARAKPAELITKHPLPIEGITVDDEGRIRINETLLDGLSGGETLEVAIKIALARMGDLRVICLDGFEALNESEQKKVLDVCTEHDVQAFVTITKDTASGEFEIKEG